MKKPALTNDKNERRTRWANPVVLRWARERLGLSLDEVASVSKQLEHQYYAPVSVDELSKWEEGSGEEPTLAQLETLAEIYVCPVGWFFLDNPPEEEISKWAREFT